MILWLTVYFPIYTFFIPFQTSLSSWARLQDVACPNNHFESPYFLAYGVIVNASDLLKLEPLYLVHSSLSMHMNSSSIAFPQIILPFLVLRILLKGQVSSMSLSAFYIILQIF